MTWLVLAVLTVGIQTAPTQPAAPFTGKWTSTEVPPPGSAPMGPPSFEVAVKDGKTIVTFERQPALEGLVYMVPPVAGAGRLTLSVNQQAPNRSRQYLVRFLNGTRAEVDLLIVPSDPAKPGTHMPLGVYTRAK
jgi:hypothetical protein